jgi:iron complex outermembrane receptor protein
VFAVAATAQEGTQEGTRDLGEASLEELGSIQVYSASKHLQDIGDAPASVTIITEEEIEKYGYRTLADILRSVNGFYVTSDRDYSNVGVRGFGRLGDWNSRVLVLVDGHRINNNILGQALIGSEFLVDVDLIQKVEVVRGPSSSLYGADAFFAVINVVTRKPPQLKGLELSFDTGSFGTYKGRASYGGQYKGVDVMLTGTFYDSAGQTLFFPEFNNPATNNGITRNTDYENYKHILATISYRGFRLQGMFSMRDKGVPTAYFGTLFADPRTSNRDSHQYFDLSYQHSVGENWQLEARTSYDQARLEAPLAYSTGLDKFSFRGNWLTSGIRLSGTLLKHHQLTFGSEVRDNLRQDQGDYSSASNAFAAEPANSTIWAMYAQDEFAITQKLTLSAGVRYDHYRGFGGTTNPRLGLIYHLFQSTTLKLLYGSAFRAPEVFETFPGLGPVFEDNPTLNSETIHSVEGIVEQKLGPHVTLSGSVFQNRIDNLITLQIDPSNSQFVYRNSQKAHAAGTEIEFTCQSASGVQGKASFSYVDTDNGAAVDTKLPNSVRHMTKLNLTVPLVPKRLFAGLEGQYMGRRLTLAGNSLGGFGVMNATLLGHALGKHLDLSASLYNLLDKKYSDPGRPEDVQDAIQQDGRNFRIKLTGRF